MMKEDFKNIIKQTVDNHTDDVTPDIIWKGIESKLSKKKKRKFLGYLSWLSAGLFTLILIVSISKYTKGYKEVTDGVRVAEVIQGTDKNSSNTEIKDEDSMDVASSIDDVDNASVGKENELTFNGNNIRVGDQKTLDQKATDTSVEEKKIFPIDINLSKTSSDQNSSEIVEVNKSLSREGKDRDLGLQWLELVDHTNTKDAGKKYFDISKLKTITNTELEIKSRVVEVESRELFLFDSPYFKEQRNIDFLTSMELYSGVAFGEKSVTDIDKVYAKSRNDSEELLEQWSAGLRFDLLRVLDFQIQSGVRYSMITDRMRMVNEYANLTEYTIVESKIIDGAIVVVDSMQVVDSFPSSIAFITEQYNSQRLISIPLEVSFGKTFNNFELGIGFGVEVNYQLSDTHVILNQEGKPAINKVGGRWVSPSFNGSFLAAYQLGDIWSLSSRFRFSGLSLSDHQSLSSLRSNYNLYGLELGLKMNFN